ncbi:MAG: type II toxin-antitoxin system VapC family toxin [Asticcacaulis sp.]
MARRLLLDTCACIWVMDDAVLSDAAVSAIDVAADEGQPVHVSPITAWEIGLLVSRGRMPMSVSPLNWFRMLMAVEGVRSSPLSPEILVASSALPGDPPRDPADRIIIATAREQGLTIVTRDRLILGYAEAGHVLAIAC